MEITLAEVLELDVLRGAGARVVTSDCDLDRGVRWVHNSEIADIASFMRGGELLLTAGLGIGSTPKLQREYMDALVSAKATGLILELGRRFLEVPAALLEEAQRRRFPVITLDREIRFMDVTESVHRAIISRQYEALQQAETVGRELNKLLLHGASLSQLVAKLAEILHNPVVLEDPAHQLVAHAKYTSDVSTLLANWEAHSRSRHEAAVRDLTTTSIGAMGECRWIPILLRGETWGRLHVLPLDTPAEDADPLVMDRAAAALGIALLGERDAEHRAEGARDALINEALEGSVETLEEFVVRATGLGVKLSDCRVVAVAIDERRPARRSESPSQAVRRFRTFSDGVRAAARDRRVLSLLAIDGSRIVGVIGVEGRLTTRQALEQLATVLSSRRPSGAAPLIVGASQIEGTIGRALEQAIEAVRYGQLIDSDEVQQFEDLGFYPLLVRLNEGPDLARYVEAELGPLLAHDASRGPKLLPTLQAYLEHGGSKSAAASALHIQRRSLYHRLERIERLLGTDLGSVERRMRLHFALRGLHILRTRRLP